MNHRDMAYEVRFRNHGGYVFSTTALMADNDQHAIRLARQRFAGGIGHSYEIWRDDRLIFGDLLDATESEQGPAHFHIHLVRHCIEQALASSDLQQRRLLMIFAEKVLGSVRKMPVHSFHKAVFSGRDGQPITEVEFPAVSSKQAFAVASALADACSEACVQFELWHEQALLGSAAGPFCPPAAEHLHETSRHIVIKQEIRLHEVCKTIAESNRLLHKINAWFRVGAMGCA